MEREKLENLLKRPQFNCKLGEEALEQVKFANFCSHASLQGTLKAIWTSTAFESNISRIFAIKLKAMGKNPGAGDMIFTWENGSGWLEFKAKKGSLSQNQKTWRQWCESLNVRYKVVKSCEEAIETLYQWEILTKPKQTFI